MHAVVDVLACCDDVHDDEIGSWDPGSSLDPKLRRLGQSARHGHGGQVRSGMDLVPHASTAGMVSTRDRLDYIYIKVHA